MKLFSRNTKKPDLRIAGEDWNCRIGRERERERERERGGGAVVPAKALMPTMLVQEHKDKHNHTYGTRGFNVVRPTMPTSTDERE